MSKPTLFFPDSGYGEERGLNDAGIQGFKRTESLARETIQNILDNPDNSGKPRIAEFEYIDLPSHDFPSLDDFKVSFEKCKQYVLAGLKDGAGNEAKFFRRGLEILSEATIPTLRIGDRNTTGLEGADDDRVGRFYRLLRSQGISSVQGPGGGTYGIGQRAPFAHSSLQTVIYSTRTADGAEAMIAKAILATYEDKQGDASSGKQAVGWWCFPPEEKSWKTVREPDLIPARFRRDAVGTDIYVTGFRSHDWQRSVVWSALQNFFAAIAAGELEVRVLKNGKLLEHVTSENLESKLDDAAATAAKTKTDFAVRLSAARYYVKAMRYPFGGGPFTTDLDLIGTINLFVWREPDNDDLPDKWVAMRRPRMVITENGSGLLKGFAAVLLCDGEQGNKYLAQMEDPAHGRWHEDEIRNCTQEERDQARRVRLDVDQFVRTTLKKLRDEESAAAKDIPLLGNYLPLEPDPDNEPAVGSGIAASNEHVSEETGHKVGVPKSGPVSGVPRAQRPPTLPITEETAMSTSGGPGPRHGNGGGGDGEADGGPGDKEGEREGGEGEPQPGRVLRGVRFRSFATGDTYIIILQADRNTEGDLILRAVGDDDSREELAVLSARNLDTGESLEVNGPRILNVRLASGSPIRLQVAVDSDIDLCLTAGA